jgi:1-phosphatidylinositol phosphodiesterase
MLSTLKSNLKVSLICLMLTFSLIEVSQAHQNESYSHDGGRKTCQPCWMKYLKDDVLLSELSIPGTHDTMSFYDTDYSQTQSMALPFQLQSGIRVLDIRCRHMGNRFRIYHGFVDQRVWFYEVLNMVAKFLEDHPSETVLMRVKEEHTPLNSNRAFEETFRKEYWEPYKKHMWQGTSVNPTLGEMRGKIVILQDFDREASINPRYGIPYSSFEIQDYFQLDGNADLYNKWEKVKKHLEDANSGPHDTKYMNYLSGAGLGSGGSLGLPFPYFVASGHSNPRTDAPRAWTGKWDRDHPNLWPNFPRINCGLLRCISFEGTNTLTMGALGTYYKNRVGIIMADFPNWGLINRTIDLNKRFRKPNQIPACGENSRDCSTQPPKRRVRTR